MYDVDGVEAFGHSLKWKCLDKQLFGWVLWAAEVILRKGHDSEYIYAFEVKGCFVWSINASCTIYLFNELDLWLFICPGFTHMLSIALESVTIPMPSLQRRVSSTRKVSADCWLDWIGGKNENLMQLKGAPQMNVKMWLLKHLYTHVMYKRTLFVFRSTIRVPSGITWSICWNHGVQKTLPVWDDWDPSLWLSYMRSILHVWCNT